MIEKINRQCHFECLFVYLLISLLYLTFGTCAIESKTFHYAYSYVMFVIAIILRNGFPAWSAGRMFWDGNLWVQAVCNLENLLLIVQVVYGHNLFGSETPICAFSLLFTRFSVSFLNFVYNLLAFIPALIAMIFHRQEGGSCNC